ncbi:ATP-binding response regulator [Paraburkholderia diazotrophica]|uniref:ATP-binding response regulator n=1 Tax=Paraburkholderia diazotrophica TaxID=667676 RepID=UPI003177FD45
MTDYRLRPQLETVEQTRDRLRRAAEAAEIGTFYCPLPLQRLYWNARCKAHFWLDPDTPDEEIDLDTFYRAIHPDDRARVRAAVENSIAGGEPYDVEYRTVSPEGEVRWLRAKGNTSFDDNGRAARFDGITIDISEQKRLEAERDALIGSERALRRAAQSANEAKDAFIAAVSHELRAPLTAILAWVDLLAQGADDPGFVRNGISVIRRNVVTQTRLVDDLMDASRINKGKFTVERTPIAVNDCFSAALQEVRPIADEKGVFVADLVADEVHVLGDGPRLRQVFSNVLNNALKHTERGGKILPSLVVTGNTVRICIADTGAGIPAERLDEIFEPFVQIESANSRERAGLGLGLAIARSIVGMHEGEIAAQSSGPGQGSTFTVMLPTVDHRSPVAPAHPQADAASIIHGRSVLLIEDDADTLEALALTLRLENMHVQTARSAHEGREALKRHLPDVIVSDLTMPGEHGCDFMKAVREQGINVPAVALTGYVRREDEQMARDAGFDDYLGKPVDPSELINVIGKLICQ